MTEFLIYSIKTAMLLAVFLLLYRMLLRKEASHTLNRCVLLASVAASFILPVIRIVRTIEAPDAGGRVKIQEMVAIAEYTDNNTIWIKLLYIIILAGSVISAAVSIYSVIKIHKILARGERTTLFPQDESIRNYTGYKHIRLTVTETETAPFSWFNNIVMSKKDYNENYNMIICHEMAHIRKGHSYDNILIVLAGIFQWFNPAIWMIRNDLTDIHEYEADKAVAASGFNLREYQLMLIGKAVGQNSNPVANSFNHSSIKSRISMMYQKENCRRAAWKALYMIPLAGFALAANAETRTVLPSNVTNSSQYAPSRDASPTSGPELRSGKENKEDTQIAVYQHNEVDTAPEFMHSDNSAFVKWVSENIVYPKEYANRTFEGTLVIGLTVSSTGKVTDVEIIKSADPLLDKTVVDLIKSSPDWTPGQIDGKPVNVRYMMPLYFTANTAKQ